MKFSLLLFRSPRRDRRDNSAPRRSTGPPRGGGGGGGGGGSRRAPPERRIFVSNIPFEMKWQEVKDLFRDNVGDVAYVELFNDENEKPRGCGILEFATEEMAKNAVEKMHRYEYKGRKIVVKEDFDTERDKYGRITKGNRSSGGDRERSDRSERRDHGPSMGGGGGGGGYTGDVNMYADVQASNVTNSQHLGTQAEAAFNQQRIVVSRLSREEIEDRYVSLF